MRTTDLITLIAAVANIGIGFFIIAKNHKRPLYIYFSAFSLITGLWALSNFLFYLAPSKILLETQYSTGALVIPVALIWFTIFIDGKIKRTNILLLLSLSLILFVIPYIGNLIISSFSVSGPHVYELKLSSFFNIYSLIPITFFAFLIFKLVIGYRRSKGIKKNQIRYILAGAAGFGGVSVLISFILPLFHISIVAPLDAQSSLIFVGFSLYAIVRHQLLDIRLVVTRSIIYGFLLTLVTLSFVFITFVSAQFFGNTPAIRNIIALAVAALIVFGLDPFKNFLSKITDRVFYQAKIDYQFLLRDVSETLAFEINRDELIRKIRNTLREGLKVKFSSTLLRVSEDGKTSKFQALPDMLVENPELHVENDSAIIHYLREHRHPSVLEALERKIDDAPETKRGPLVASKADLDRMGAALITPIFAQNHLIAVLVMGPKLSGDSFTNDDLQLLEVLSPQIGSAIQKANLFEEVRQFGASLQVKVDQATSELRDRNVSLLTIQKITKDITQTLDFNKVVQDIANSVSTELGYLGAVLVFLDDDGKTVRARAITETALTQKALKLLPIKFDQYETDITAPTSTSLGHQVIRSGEIKMTEDFADVVSPPLPKLLAHTIQKVVGIKAMVLIPIISEQKTIGVIEIGVQKKMSEITQQEIATMQSMADELGVVSRNIRLFDQIRKTNLQLEDANKHLQELDRAKSEFVSIASHQLRTPMTGIMGYLSMMTQGDFGKLAPEHAKILSDLLAESQRMIRLINQFLNVSKIEAGKFSYQKSLVQIEDLIQREIKETQKAATDKGLKLQTKLPKDPLPKAVADADKLQDVILNLIDNAIKYTNEGTITVGAEILNGQLHFFVKDTGIGIKHEDAPELFNKFVRGSGIAQIHPDGSGLGLFIAKSIIDAHGGRIWADSEGEGKGSTFQFVIPLGSEADLTPPIAKGFGT